MSELTHGADLFEDGYPHGTVEGYNDGCRGGYCPTGVEFGLSCKRAKMLAAGDYRYTRWVAQGLTPAEISAALTATDNLGTPTRKETPVMTAPAPAPKPAPPKTRLAVDPITIWDAPEPTSAAQPLAERAQDTAPQEDAGAPVIETETPTAPSEPTVEAEAMGHHPISTDKWTTGLTATQKTARLREIREWCRTHGFPGVPVKGKIPQDALAAYDDAFEGRTGNDYTEILDEARDRATGTEPAENATPDTADETPQPENGTEPDGDGPRDFMSSELGVALAQEISAAYSAALDSRIEDDLPDGIITPELADTLGQLKGELVTNPSGLEVAIAAAANSETRPLPTPEWADVTTSEDVEQARSLTSRIWDQNTTLEEQLATVTRERDEARTALALTLTKWDHERHNAGAYRLLHQIARTDAQQAWGTADILLEQLQRANTRADRLVELLANRRSVWGRIFG